MSDLLEWLAFVREYYDDAMNLFRIITDALRNIPDAGTIKERLHYFFEIARHVFDVLANATSETPMKMDVGISLDEFRKCGEELRTCYVRLAAE